MKFRVFICVRGDIFIFDAESGEHLWSPYGSDDPTMPFRRLVVQEFDVISCDDLEESCEILSQERKYRESWRYETWVSQLVSAISHKPESPL